MKLSSLQAFFALATLKSFVSSHSLRSVEGNVTSAVNPPESDSDPLMEAFSEARQPDTDIENHLQGAGSFHWQEMQDVLAILSDYHNLIVDGISEDLHTENPPSRDESGPFEPIRFKLDFSPLDARASQNPNNPIKINAIKEITIPEAISQWSEAIYVERLKNPLTFRDRIGGSLGNCFDTPLPGEPVADTDLFLIVDGRNDDEYPCDLGYVGAFAGPCIFDNLPFNPRAGRLTMCLDRIDLVNGVIPQRELDSQVFIQMHEIGHILGVGSDLFQFYTNPSTGEPYGVRRGDFPCVEEGGGTIDTLPQNVQANSYGEGDRERLFYEVTTPTVTRVVQNKFGCDTITGARLENQPTSGGRIGRCIGVHFDERLFYDDLMGAIANQVLPANHLSPFSLALLEDSGWYKVDYTKSIPRSFGLGAGCDFVTKDCLDPATGDIPEYSKGIFCNDREDEFDRCDPTHSAKAFCSSFLLDIPDEYQYFPDLPRLGGVPIQLDYCPVAANNVELCGEGRKCFLREQSNSVCLEATCNEAINRVEFIVRGRSYVCEQDFDVFDIIGVGDVICPRFASACPHLTCPSLCSGRGTCDWSDGPPHCICDDEDDNTVGCTSFFADLVGGNAVRGGTGTEPFVVPSVSPTGLLPTTMPSHVPTKIAEEGCGAIDEDKKGRKKKKKKKDTECDGESDSEDTTDGATGEDGGDEEDGNDDEENAEKPKKKKPGKKRESGKRTLRTFAT